MTPRDNGNPLRIGPERIGELLIAAKGATSPETAAVSASGLLVELSQCLNSLLDLLQTTVSCIRPTSNQTLPSVAMTLSGIVQATETAALKVLDETEALGSDRDRLCEALARLEPFVSTSDPAARRAWEESMESCQALSARIISITSAMEFQDLTAQHLAVTIKSVEEVRQRLLQILSLLYLPFEPEEPLPPPGKLTDRLGDPATLDHGHQALADQLLAELAEQEPGSPR